ncbi:MAG: hypothetical protein QW051_00680 [Candidatus Aenigmatarchaeota archaeon]
MSYVIEIKCTQHEVPKTLWPVNGQVKRVLWKDLTRWSTEIYTQWKNQALTDFKMVTVDCQQNSFLLIRGIYDDKIPEKELKEDWHSKYFPWLYQNVDYDDEARQIISTYSKKVDFATRRLLNQMLTQLKKYFKEKMSLISRAVTFAQGGIVVEMKLTKEDGTVLFEADNRKIYEILIGEQHEKTKKQ